MASLYSEIRQKKPFVNLQEEASVNLLRSAAAWEATFDRMLAAHDITITQYNVLRILRGAGADGLCRQEIQDRLINRAADVTRLLDRMEEAKLIARKRSTEDRRMVNTFLTARGRKIVDDLDSPATKEHARRLNHLSDSQLRMLVELLTLVREKLD